mmetsp:Transcript_38953/g.122904  ORF Transcript_38953/g.122904 Transcript_38953/m.122904 type:complete len:95 (-) Transcript_38953:674-958(-)
MRMILHYGSSLLPVPNFEGSQQILEELRLNILQLMLINLKNVNSSCIRDMSRESSATRFTKQKAFMDVEWACMSITKSKEIQGSSASSLINDLT